MFKFELTLIEVESIITQDLIPHKNEIAIGNAIISFIICQMPILNGLLTVLYFIILKKLNFFFCDDQMLQYT